MLCNTSMDELALFPSHFDMEEKTKTKDAECTLKLPTIRHIQDRIKDGESEHFCDSQVNLREHFKCRDLNLTLFLEYKMSMQSAPGTPQQMQVVRKMIKATVDYPDNMIAWSNLAHVKLEQKQVDEVERCLKKLKDLSLRPWEQVLADAEMAYAYRRIGPRGHEYCKMLCRKVVHLDGYPSLTDLEAAPIWLDELKVEYSYEAALVIQRLLNPTGHSDSLDGEGDHPEELMKESAQMLKTVVFSPISGTNVYETIGWLTLSETFRLYKKVNPYEKRTLEIVNFGWLGIDSAEQCLEKAVESVEASSLPNVSFRALHMLGKEFRNKHRPYYDLDKAERYLKQAAELSNKPAIQHHLALVYRQKWINERGYSERGAMSNANIRDPGHPLLKKAISHLEKADKYSCGTSVLFRVDLARLKYSHSEGPISEESRDDIMDILNGCILYTKFGLTTSSIQSYLFHELALMHQALFNDMVKCRQYLELSVEKAHKAKNYSHALLQLKEIVEAESLTDSERYRKLGDMYTIFKRYDSARWNLEKARESHPQDPDILENLVVSLIGLEEFQGARQCLILLRDIDNSRLETKLNKERYMDVSMKVAQQFSVGIAASIYQELIMNLRPKIAADTIIVISSEEPSDTVKTNKLVYMIRHGLGFTEDNCILPIEVAELHGNFYYLENFVKKAWCVVIHLTNIVIGEGLESLLRDIDNSIEDIWERKGRVVVVDDVTSPGGSTDWKQSTGKMRRCQPWISYSELFHPNLEEEVNAAELLPRDEQALDSVEDCATALQSRLHMTDPSKSTAPEGRGEPQTEMRESTVKQTVPASEQRESTAGDKREVSVTEQGNSTVAVRMDVSGITQSSRITAEEGEVSANEQGTSTAANEVPASEQSNRTAAEGMGEGMSVPEAIGAPLGEDATELQSWSPSALERLIRAMLSDSQVNE